MINENNINDKIAIRNLFLFGTTDINSIPLQKECTDDNYRLFTVPYPIIEELLNLHYINSEIKYRIDNVYHTCPITVKDIIEFCKKYKQVLVTGAVSVSLSPNIPVSINKLVSIGVICKEKHDEKLRQLIWDTFIPSDDAQMDDDMAYSMYDLDNDPLYEDL